MMIQLCFALSPWRKVNRLKRGSRDEGKEQVMQDPVVNAHRTYDIYIVTAFTTEKFPAVMKVAELRD